MPVPVRDWRTYYSGQPALCPGVKLGKAERRRLRDRREDDRGERRYGQPPAPELLTRCQAVFIRVGLGWVWRIRWVADPWHELPSGLLVNTHMCRDCHTVFEAEAERVTSARAS